MRVLLLGTGMQGKAALDHLARSKGVEAVTAADRDLPSLQRFVAERGYGPEVSATSLDASDRRELGALVSGGFDVVVDLLPVPFIGRVAEAAVAAGVHLVNTFYTTPDLIRLAPEALDRGIAILPELGMDPGIDLLLLGESVRSFDRIDEILSYGAGIPEPAAATNALGYKISWTFEGVLRSYARPAVLVRNGTVVRIAPADKFAPDNVHTVTVDGVGDLESYASGDVTPYLDVLDLSPASLRSAGRYTMRYPGHAAFWHAVSHLHLLDDDPVMVNGVAVDRKKFLAAALEPHLQYDSNERDLAILIVEVAGSVGGAPRRVVHEVVDTRDMTTGFTAMSRLVGFSASIGAQMLASGQPARWGLLSPVTDVPFAPFMNALEQEGVRIRTKVMTGPDAA